MVAAHPFADHFPYRHDDIQPILDEAFQLGAIPVTTAKDAVRLPPDQRQQVDVVPVTVRWEAPAALQALLAAKGIPVADPPFQQNPAAIPGGQETAP